MDRRQDAGISEPLIVSGGKELCGCTWPDRTAAAGRGKSASAGDAPYGRGADSMIVEDNWRKRSACDFGVEFLEGSGCELVAQSPTMKVLSMSFGDAPPGNTSCGVEMPYGRGSDSRARPRISAGARGG